MKVIGVTGRSGSGKSTFSDYLGKKKNVGIIHVDDLVGIAKNKYFKAFTIKGKYHNDPSGEKKNPVLNSKIKTMVYKNKYLFNLLMFVRSSLVRKPILDKIEEFKKDGKELVLIDDWALLREHKDVLKRINTIYVTERKSLDRRRGLTARDGMSLRDVTIGDIPFALRYITYPDIYPRIHNGGSLGELFKQATKIYQEFVPPTFDERYRIENLGRDLTLGQALRNTREYNRNKEHGKN